MLICNVVLVTNACEIFALLDKSGQKNFGPGLDANVQTCVCIYIYILSLSLVVSSLVVLILLSVLSSLLLLLVVVVVLLLLSLSLPLLLLLQVKAGAEAAATVSRSLPAVLLKVCAGSCWYLSNGDLTIISPTIISETPLIYFEKMYCQRGETQGLRLTIKSCFKV